MKDQQELRVPCGKYQTYVCLAIRPTQFWMVGFKRFLSLMTIVEIFSMLFHPHCKQLNFDPTGQTTWGTAELFVRFCLLSVEDVYIFSRPAILELENTFDTRYFVGFIL